MTPNEVFFAYHQARIANIERERQRFRLRFHGGPPKHDPATAVSTHEYSELTKLYKKYWKPKKKKKQNPSDNQ